MNCGLVVSLSENILLSYTHFSCEDVRWQNACVMRQSEANDMAIVVDYL